MSTVKNILFVMADQWRFDYLSCYGHPHLDTPNLDKLASRGVRFDRAYAPSPVCGPSRASFYTGRNAFSHGATWNLVPLPVSELTIGDYLADSGYTTAVVGKTHMLPDTEGMARLGLTPDTEIGMRVAHAGFEPYERDDGLHPTPLLRFKGGQLSYNDYLREHGYEGENPWNDYANAAEGPDGEILSGWYLENSHLPARVAEEHSETAYMTQRAKEFITEMGDEPWLLHLSYIKPHWPYMAPAPYHDMYGPETFIDVLQSDVEREDPNEVYEAFMDMTVSRSFSDPSIRTKVIGAYMGLIKQIDDHLGKLFDWLDESGRADDTMNVFTSDHGDYLGDHFMGEKELFHEVSAKIPLIIVDPRSEADATRGTACDALVEGIDLVPTFLEATDTPPVPHRIEGTSLQPFLHGTTPDQWRPAAFSEIDYGIYPARATVDAGPSDARAYMMRTDRWKYVYFKGFPPQLFDLDADPNEYVDLGRNPDYESVRHEMLELLVDRLTSRKNRITWTDETILGMASVEKERGIVIGVIEQPPEGPPG